MFFKVYQLPFFFNCALRSGGIREKWTRSNGDRSWSGQNLHQKEKENYECYELHSFVIIQHEIPKRWLGKISTKDAFIFSHRLTGFPVEGGNPWAWEKIRGTRVAIPKMIPLLPFTQDLLIWKRWGLWMDLIFYQMISMLDNKQYFVWKMNQGTCTQYLIKLICVEMDINIWELSKSPIKW